MNVKVIWYQIRQNKRILPSVWAAQAYEYSKMIADNF